MLSVAALAAIKLAGVDIPWLAVFMPIIVPSIAIVLYIWIRKTDKPSTAQRDSAK